jgi:hypothetical protein
MGSIRVNLCKYEKNTIDNQIVSIIVLINVHIHVVSDYEIVPNYIGLYMFSIFTGCQSNDMLLEYILVFVIIVHN